MLHEKWHWTGVGTGTKTKKGGTEMIEENLNMIRKIVWSYVKTNPGLEFDDLMQEACVAYLEASSSYDPTAYNTKKTTFTYHVITNRLNTLIRRENLREIKEREAREIFWISDHVPTPEQELMAKEAWLDFLLKLSPEAQALCLSLTTEDLKVHLPTDKPKQCRGIIIKELRGKGWKWADIWKSFKEIKQTLSPII
jgi:RNA polymerase sigma factor (sigma-70 family)